MALLKPSEVKALIREVGEPVTFSYTTGEVTDPATGEVLTPGSKVEVEGFGHPGRYTADQVNGTNIQAGDIRLVAEAVATRPEPGWQVEVDGKTYRVMDVQPDRFAGATGCYVCQVRAQ